MDGSAITGFKKQMSLEFLQKAEEDSDPFSTRGRAFQSLWGRVGESLEAEPLFGVVFIHTWNTKARLRRQSKRLWWFIARNQLLKMLWSCVTEAVVCQWKSLVVNTILHRQPVEVFQDRLDLSSLLCQCKTPCCCFLH